MIYSIFVEDPEKNFSPSQVSPKTSSIKVTVMQELNPWLTGQWPRKGRRLVEEKMFMIFIYFNYFTFILIAFKMTRKTSLTWTQSGFE